MMKTLHYLIVDDEPLVRQLLTDVFSDEASISTATDGMEALKLLAKIDFDLIICDVDMPHLNGIDFFKRIKNNKLDVCDNFLFCTGNITDDFVLFCSTNEIPFCNKPVNLSLLKNTVHKMVEFNTK